MSGTSDIPEGDGSELDMLAAEYVLGVLEEAERREVRLRAQREPALAAAIAAWERRLAPMDEALQPVPPPPALWQRIAAATAQVPDETPRPLRRPAPAQASGQAPGRRRWAWPAATAASLALAAGLAAFVVLRPPAGAPAFAVLMPVNAPQAAFVAQAARDGAVLLASLSPQQVPAGRDLELWTLPPGAQKVAPLGVLPAGGRVLRLSAPPATGTQFLVSLEPAGGSPTGQPTGPVLYEGTFGGPANGGTAN